MKILNATKQYLLFFTCFTWSLPVPAVSPQEPINVIHKLSSEIDVLEAEKKELKEKLEGCEEEKENLEYTNDQLQYTNNKLNELIFGDNVPSEASSDPTYADSENSDEPETPSVIIGNLEHQSETLEERLANCQQAQESLQEVKEALRNCQQLSGVAKVGAGAAGLTQLTPLDAKLPNVQDLWKNPKKLLKNPQGFVLKSSSELGFILFKKSAKEIIPKKTLIPWDDGSLLDSHELTEITAEALKAYAHGKNPKELALVSAQVFARVKIMEQLDKYGFKKMTDKLEYHTSILVRGLLCKGVDVAIEELIVLTKVKDRKS